MRSIKTPYGTWVSQTEAMAETQRLLVKQNLTLGNGSEGE